jgi:hypothetical protein
VIGMDCFLNNQAASVYLLKAITKTNYDKERNEFVKIKKDKYELDNTMNESTFGQSSLNSSRNKDLNINSDSVLEL